MADSLSAPRRVTACGRGSSASSCSCSSPWRRSPQAGWRWPPRRSTCGTICEAAKSQLAAVPELVKAGDTAQFDQAAAQVLEHTSSADEIVQGPLWSFASAVPFVGQNIAAVRDVTEATHILVRDALPPSFGVLSAVQADKIRFEGGGFNLEALRGALAALPAIDEAFSAAQQKVDGIDRSALLPIVDDAIGQVLDVIVDTAPLVHSATEVLPTALQMLGETEPRTYFVDVPEQRRDPRDRRQPRRRRAASRRGRSRLARRADRLGRIRGGRRRRTAVRRSAARDPRAVLPGLPAVLAELHPHPELPDDGGAVPGDPRCDRGSRSTASSRSTRWRSRTCSRSPGR